MAERRWAWLPAAGEPVEVLGRDELWGRRVDEIVVPSSQRRLRVPADEVVHLGVRKWSEAEVTWRAAATRALGLAAEGEPLVTARASVRLLPHQLATLERALGMDPVRLAVCDEVGLGKTITAGAIFAEMKARGRVRRAVVVAPKGVQLQWVAEMADRFGEDFVRVGPEGVPVDSGVDPWRSFDRVVCRLDAVKPLRQRAGWSPEQVEAYNAARFRAVVDAGWDMVIIDEAHHVAGSSDDVARYRLAVELAAATRHVLLLSATPHSGKSDGFRRFLGLIDDGFVQGRPVQRATVAPHVARTEKRLAVDQAGRALFQPRETTLRVAPYTDREIERELYEAVTEYVRSGWDAAKRQGRRSAGFLVLLMQRLMASSTSAILAALEKRSAALGERGAQLALFVDRDEDWADLTGEEQYRALTEARGPAWETERAELSELLSLARDAAAAGADTKVGAFFSLLGELRRSEQDPEVKVLVFTEFVPTQAMLLDLLEAAGITAVAINGSMSLGERALAQEAFRERAQILVSTDAGGEGINLQFAHVVVNWDLPWSPSRLEQRIGRVDRIGQTATVRAFNLVCEHSVEARVLDVLDAKLEVILTELGADKRCDVLESAARRADGLWTTAILDPDGLDRQADEFARDTRSEACEAAQFADLVDATAPVVGASRPERIAKLVEVAAEAKKALGRPVDDPLDALAALPEMAPGEPCPVIRVPEAQAGWLSIWEVTPDGEARGATAVFQPDAGLVRPDLSATLWDRCCMGVPLADHRTPDTGTWERITAAGVDHAYEAVARLAGKSELTLPGAQLRLLVRVDP
ncbi:MAG: helicase [Acidimicrobiaceae bacterium]|nr:helicase [Acidimicrobiaceae bacterium]MYE98368.1 helicase [Acidimicrobiaceae bacterium]MYI54685.1 helicase [Acidimicrobiaceae bacterium]